MGVSLMLCYWWKQSVGTLQGQVRDMEFESESEEDFEEEEVINPAVRQSNQQPAKKSGIFSLFKYSWLR